MSTIKNETLTPKQEIAIVALLREPSIPKAAVAAGVHEKTIYRWSREPDFSAAYRQARRDAFGQAIAQCQYYSGLAVNTLARVMTEVGTPAHAKVSAALGVLKFGRDGIELEDLAARIAALESAQRAETGMTTPPPSPNPWSDDEVDAEPDGGATGVAA